MYDSTNIVLSQLVYAQSSASLLKMSKSFKITLWVAGQGWQPGTHPDAFSLLPPPTPSGIRQKRRCIGVRKVLGQSKVWENALWLLEKQT